MALNDDIKILLRISSTAYDTEIDDLIDACHYDLLLSGVRADKLTSFIADPSTDKLLKRAFSTYVKANFGWDNPDSEGLTNSYNMLKAHLTLSIDYSFYMVTINTSEQQSISFDGIVKESDEDGTAIFYTKGGNHLQYVTSASTDYVDVSEDVVVNVV